MAVAVILAYLVALALVLAWATKSSGAAANQPSGLPTTAAAPEPPARCPGARRAIAFYHGWYHRHVNAMKRPERHATHDRGKSCGWARELAVRWRTRAQLARERLAAWRHYHYAWQDWLPAKWQRIAYCETHKGRYIPGDWRHDSGRYQGAFGFYHGSWDAFVPRADAKAGPYPSEAYLATPRQQYEVALAIWRMYGFSGWGCRSA